MIARTSLIFGFACILAGCAFSDEQKHCSTADDCGSGQRCYKGFCVQSEDDSESAGMSSRGDAGTGTGSISNPSSASGSRASGGNGSGGNGSGGNAGKGGTGDKPGAADGGKPNASGSCSDGEEQPCLVEPDSKTASESCNRGTQRCSSGTWGVCISEPMPAVEQCNGLDDDCDKLVDETPEDCFPDGQSGCTQGAAGSWKCEGVCALGKLACKDGKPGECTGFKAAAAEACTGAGATAADENCDGATDETCSCTEGEKRPCYTGRAGTEGVGKCVAGTQACTDGVLGACTGSVTPTAETCANQGADDDCDGMVDNIPTIGAACVAASNMGACRSGLLQCQAGTAELTCVPTLMPAPESCNNMDDDCNGKVDDGFDLQTDAMNCGGCGQACASGESCCGGRCADLRTDAGHCGKCGTACAAGSACAAAKCSSTGGGGSPAAGTGAGTGAAGTGEAGRPAAGAPAAGAPAAGAPSMDMCVPACTGGKMCCGGTCVDPKTDAKNCGTCGNACTTGTQPGCCGSTCVDLVSTSNCGACGKDCSLLTNSTLTCTCSKGSDGVACRGPLLDLCL